jgi:KAP family P-loop domain
MKDFLPLIVDREIDDSKHDAFGHLDFAVLLEKVITDRTIVPPYSIGLLGPWGTGKSSIKELCIKIIKGKSQAPDFEVQTITFNAWRFGGENLKRALLREIFIGVGGSEKDILDALSRTRISDSLEDKEPGELKKEALNNYLYRLVQALLIFAFVLAVNSFLPKNAPWYPLVSGAASLLTVGLMGWLLNLDQLVISRFSRVWRAEPPRSSAEEFEVLLLERLTKDNKNLKKFKRVVIFVDDLDRLSSEEMMTGLEAIRSFLELPRNRLPEGLGIIFVVSCDEERIAEALSRRARTGDVPINLKDKHEGRRYLDRVFQYRLEIPPLPRADMRVFAKDKLKSLPELLTALNLAGANTDDVLERLIHPAVTNPRQALQLVNAFAQAWWFAERREFQGAGTVQPGSLGQGSVTKFPEALAVLCVLRLDFADFYRELEEEPSLLRAFFLRFLMNQNNTEGEGIERVLVRLSDSTLENNTSEKKLVIHHNFRPLRTYLSGVQSVRFPERLEPLLRLSEDHVTRRYGDSALKIRNALIQGDDQGILEQFGRRLDKNPLSKEDANLLRQFVLDLGNEHISRRINAAGALTKILERLPEASRLDVFNPVAAWARQSSDVRARIGARGMKPFLLSITLDERQALLEPLTKDAIDGTFGPQIEALGAVTNEQKLDDCLAIFELILAIRGKGVLPLSVEQAWKEWIPTRQVKTADEALPISRLVSLSQQVENATLIGDWVDEYSAALVEDSGVLSGQDKNALSSLEAVLQVLFARNSSAVWERLIDILKTEQLAAIEVILQKLEQWMGSAPKDAKSAIIQHAATYLFKLLKPDVAYDTQISLLKSLTRWITSYGADIKPEAVVEVVQICGLVNKRSERNEESFLSFAIQAMEKLKVTQKKLIQPAIAVWVNDFPTGTLEEIDKWMGANFGLIGDAPRDELLQKLTGLAGKPDIAKGGGLAFRYFMDSVQFSIDAQNPHLKSVLTQAFSVITNYVNSAYLTWYTEIFPSLPKFIDAVPLEAGNALHSLFQNATSYPDVFSAAMDAMSGHWIGNVNNKYGRDYNLANVIANANSILVSYPQQPYSGNVLDGFTEILEKNLVPKSGNAINLVARALAVQPVASVSALKAASVAFESVTPENLRQFVSQSSLDDNDQVTALKQLFQAIRQSTEVSSLDDYAIALLSDPARQHDEKPDYILDLWLENSTLSEAEINLLKDNRLNDGQAHRLWTLTLNLLTLEQVLGVLPDALADVDRPQYQNAIFTYPSKITAMAASQSERVRLFDTIFQIFSSTSSIDFQRKLAQWLKEIDDKELLRPILKRNPGLDEERKLILVANFSALKKAISDSK